MFTVGGQRYAAIPTIIMDGLREFGHVHVFGNLACNIIKSLQDNCQAVKKFSRPALQGQLNLFVLFHNDVLSILDV